VKGGEIKEGEVVGKKKLEPCLNYDQIDYFWKGEKRGEPI
jgi:hypothetical protein